VLASQKSGGGETIDLLEFGPVPSMFSRNGKWIISNFGIPGNPGKGKLSMYVVKAHTTYTSRYLP
jgi:hypothetical protein